MDALMACMKNRPDVSLAGFMSQTYEARYLYRTQKRMKATKAKPLIKGARIA